MWQGSPKHIHPKSHGWPTRGIKGCPIFSMILLMARRSPVEVGSEHPISFFLGSFIRTIPTGGWVFGISSAINERICVHQTSKVGSPMSTSVEIQTPLCHYENSYYFFWRDLMLPLFLERFFLKGPVACWCWDATGLERSRCSDFCTDSIVREATWLFGSCATGSLDWRPSKAENFKFVPVDVDLQLPTSRNIQEDWKIMNDSKSSNFEHDKHQLGDDLLNVVQSYAWFQIDSRVHWPTLVVRHGENVDTWRGEVVFCGTLVVGLVDSGTLNSTPTDLALFYWCAWFQFFVCRCCYLIIEQWQCNIFV